jgi:hypothetical protein
MGCVVEITCAIPSLRVNYGHLCESPCTSCMHDLPTATVAATATSVASISSRVPGDKVVSRTEGPPGANLNTRAAGRAVSMSFVLCGTQLLGNSSPESVGMKRGTGCRSRVRHGLGKPLLKHPFAYIVAV